jgi:hypothetical protein
VEEVIRAVKLSLQKLERLSDYLGKYFLNATSNFDFERISSIQSGIYFYFIE